MRACHFFACFIALANLLKGGDSFVLGFGKCDIIRPLSSSRISSSVHGTIGSSSSSSDATNLLTVKADRFVSVSSEIGDPPPRREFLSRVGLGLAGFATAALMSPTLGRSYHNAGVARAAPPIAVIAEELGYFPVQNRAGDLVYVPKRVQRESSEQAIELAKKMSEKGAVMYGAFWCPHCARQKELLGREAFQYIKYVECSPKGFGAQPLLCNKKDVDGYPTWVFKDKTVLGGERPLEDFAKQVKYAKFDPQLEQNVPPSLGSSACK